jgi:hypothetical protein
MKINVRGVEIETEREVEWNFKQALQARKEALENVAKQGVIPGEMDSCELEQMKGRIKELGVVLNLLGDDNVYSVVNLEG